MENGLRMLTISVALVLVCGVLSLGFLFAGRGDELATMSGREYQVVAQEISGSYEDAYNGKLFTGGDVLQIIGKEELSIPIDVVDGDRVVSFPLPREHKNDVHAPDSFYYVDPAGSYSAGLLYGEEFQDVIKLIFTKQA